MEISKNKFIVIVVLLSLLHGRVKYNIKDLLISLDYYSPAAARAQREVIGSHILMTGIPPVPNIEK